MRKILKILGILYIVYVVFGFLLCPIVIRHFGERILQEKVDSVAEIESVRVNPFNLSVHVMGISIPNEVANWNAAVERASVNLSIRSLYKFHPVFNKIELVGPNFGFERSPEQETDREVVEEDVAISLEDLVEQINATEIPEVTIDLLVVDRGEIHFMDETNVTPFSTVIEPLSFSLSNFTTEKGGENQMIFNAVSESGAKLSINASFETVPVGCSGTIRFENFELNTLSPYFSQFVKFDLAKAVFGLEANFSVNFGDFKKLIEIEGKHISLTEMLCLPRNADGRILSVDLARVEGVYFGFPSMGLVVDKVLVKDAVMQVNRDADEKIDLFDLFVTPEVTAQTETPKAQVSASASEDPYDLEKRFSYMVKEVSLENYKVLWQDDLEVGLVSLQVEVPQLFISNVSSNPEEPFNLVADCIIAESGQIHVEGSIASDVSMVELQISMKDLPLGVASIYGQKYVSLDVHTGFLSFDGHISGSLEDAFVMVGDTSIADFSAEYLEYPRGSMSWKELSLDGIRVNSEPLSVSVEEIILNAPEGELVMKSSVSGQKPVDSTVGQLNETVMELESGFAPDINVGSLQIREGRFVLIDKGVTPELELVLSELEAELNHISLIADKRMRLDIGGKLNAGDFKVNGETSISNPKVETAFQFSLGRFELPVFSPYSGAMIGRRINKGWLSLDSNFSIKAEQLDAKNKMIIEQFELGESVPSEIALNLPYDLAIALLKGPGGVMDLSLPLSGDLSDPKAGIGQIVRTAFVGLITSVASSPFNMLSGLVDSELDLSFVEFAGGDVTLDSKGINQLNTLAEALKKRPELQLKLTPEISKQEIFEFKREKFLEQMSAKNVAPASESYAQLVEESYFKLNTEMEVVTPAVDLMEKKLMETISVDSGEIEKLMNARVTAIRVHLTQSQGIPEQKVSTEDALVDAEKSGVRIDLK